MDLKFRHRFAQLRQERITLLTKMIHWIKQWITEWERTEYQSRLRRFVNSDTDSLNDRRKLKSSSEIDWLKHLTLTFDQNDSLTQTQTGVNLSHNRNDSFNWKICLFRHGLAERSKSYSGMKRLTASWSTHWVQHKYSCTFTLNLIHWWVDITQNPPQFSL